MKSIPAQDTTIHDPFVCSSSRAKLDAFRYAPKRATEMEDELSEQPTQEAGEMEQTETKPETGETRPIPCPETPVHKIPLADMISNTEDALNNAPEKEITPGDHVFWDHGGSFSHSTPNTASKRRNRSLSPSSSPSYITRDRSFTMLTSDKVMLTTPQHDAAADLWTRYVSKADGLPECNVPPSPHTPGLRGSARKAASLRRTNSCAIDWPKSATKGKRPADWLGSNRRTRRPLTREEGEQCPFGNSRISMLVDRIQESLLKKSRSKKENTPAPAPPSSSPLPDRIDEQPSKRMRFTIESPSKLASTRRGQPNALPSSNKDPVSSDYGYDDQDQEFFELAAASANEAFLNTQKCKDMPNTLRPDTHTNYDTFPQLAKDMSDDSDDFDNDDYDGMDEIIATYNKNNPFTATTNTAHITATNTTPVTPQKGQVKRMVPEEGFENIMELDAFDSDAGDNVGRSLY